MFWQLTNSVLYWLAQNGNKAPTEGVSRWFMVPVPDLEDPTTYHHYFNHAELDNLRNQLYSGGSVAQLLAVNTAMNYSEMLERAFRARHATIIQSYGHAISRCLAQQHPFGIFKIVQEYVAKLSQIPQRS